MDGKRPVRYNRRFLPQRDYRHDQIPQEPPPEKPSKKLFWTLGIIFIIFVAGIALLFLFFSGENTEKSSEESSLSTTDSVIEPSVILCESWDCLMDASENCDLSNYTNTLTLTLFGLDVTTTTYYEISGEEENKCIFKIRTEEQHVEISDELTQQMLDGGATQEEIDQQEIESNELSDLLEGREGSCKFNPTDLVNMLTRWSTGEFSGGVSCTLEAEAWNCTYTGDFDVAESCEGEYFSSEL